VRLVLETIKAAKKKSLQRCNSIVTKGFSIPPKHTTTWLSYTALYRLCQGAETITIMRWPKISFPFSRQNAFTEQNSRALPRLKFWLMRISGSTTMNEFSWKQEKHR